jgi:hypothetical protein
MATLPAAAALFVRGDVRAAKALWVGQMNREREADLLRRAGAWSLVDAASVGVPRERALAHRVALVTEGRAVPTGAFDLSSGELDLKSFGGRIPSDTDELLWDWDAAKHGVVTVNTPRSKAVIGYGGGRRFVLGDFTIEPGQGVQEGWCAITMTFMGSGSGAEVEKRLPAAFLITAAGYAENTGMQWKNAEKSSVGRNWGTAPSRVEGVPARVTLPVTADKAEAWSLDERGQRKQKLPLAAGPGGKAVLAIGPQWQTLWYEVVLR